MLSYKNLCKLLGKDIYIYPFEPANFKGVTIDLTTSKLAWSVLTKNSIYDAATDEIVVPPNDTALVESEESIYISNRIGGTFHSKVSLVSKGLGHIGTTLDPEWIGPVLIALHNNTNQEIRIKRGGSLVSLMLYKLSMKSPIQNNNLPGRPHILNGYNLTQDEWDWIDENWRKTPQLLKEKLKSCNEYKKLKKEFNKRFWNNYNFWIWTLSILLVASIGIFAFRNSQLTQTQSESLKILIPSLIAILVTVMRIKKSDT